MLMIARRRRSPGSCCWSWSPLTGGVVLVILIITVALLVAIAAVSAPQLPAGQSTVGTSSPSD